MTASYNNIFIEQKSENNENAQFDIHVQLSAKPKMNPFDILLLVFSMFESNSDDSNFQIT